MFERQLLEAARDGKLEEVNELLDLGTYNDTTDWVRHLLLSSLVWCTVQGERPGPHLLVAIKFVMVTI